MSTQGNIIFDNVDFQDLGVGRGMSIIPRDSLIIKNSSFRRIYSTTVTPNFSSFYVFLPATITITRRYVLISLFIYTKKKQKQTVLEEIQVKVGHNVDLCFNRVLISEIKSIKRQ